LRNRARGKNKVPDTALTSSNIRGGIVHNTGRTDGKEKYRQIGKKTFYEEVKTLTPAMKGVARGEKQHRPILRGTRRKRPTERLSLKRVQAKEKRPGRSVLGIGSGKKVMMAGNKE